MAPKIFSGRKDARLPQPGDWRHYNGSVNPPQENRVLLPPIPVKTEAPAAAKRNTAMTSLEELLEGIDAFRGVIADALYETSKDYQILCNLAHADLRACEEIVTELRQRLAGNTHYSVLAKLDEAFTLVKAQVDRKSR
jgi:hypothetical protein